MTCQCKQMGLDCGTTRFLVSNCSGIELRRINEFPKNINSSTCLLIRLLSNLRWLTLLRNTFT